MRGRERATEWAIHHNPKYIALETWSNFLEHCLPRQHLGSVLYVAWERSWGGVKMDDRSAIPTKAAGTHPHGPAKVDEPGPGGGNWRTWWLKAANDRVQTHTPAA